MAAYSQDARQLRKNADSLLKSKNYAAAAQSYRASASLADFALPRINSLYNAARCYSLAGRKDSAFILLNESIHAGYRDKAHLLQDPDLNSLHAEAAWQALAGSVKEEKKVLNKNPGEAALITEDVHRFWEAYDRAQGDSANRLAIYKKFYFDKSSGGMQDYMGLKVRSIKYFVDHLDGRPKFYRAIRRNTLQVDSLKPAIYACFEKLKTIYPEALFPDVYFIIGAYTSAGTTSNAGLLIGINQVCRTDSIPTGELSLWEKNNFNLLSNLPGIISHELIHFQQDELLKRADTTTLFYCLVEGMADFMGELICGNYINQRLAVWAKGKEKRIWQAFTRDMYLDRYSNWIANANQETPDNPADQGYWIGYQICKAYYDRAPDKKKAISDMLHFKDAGTFLRESGWEEKLKAGSSTGSIRIEP
jgi:predicted Zn-dependent protease DUF2268